MLLRITSRCLLYGVASWLLRVGSLLCGWRVAGLLLSVASLLWSIASLLWTVASLLWWRVAGLCGVGSLCGVCSLLGVASLLLLLLLLGWWLLHLQVGSSGYGCSSGLVLPLLLFRRTTAAAYADGDWNHADNDKGKDWAHNCRDESTNRASCACKTERLNMTTCL